MKKNDLVEMIKAHVYHNEATFTSLAYDVAREFNEAGDVELSDYILSLLATGHTFVQQNINIIPFFLI